MLHLLITNFARELVRPLLQKKKKKRKKHSSMVCESWWAPDGISLPWFVKRKVGRSAKL
jgi:hypothetical protein